MEGVLTSMLAWFVFKENFVRRIFIGMLLIVSAGALLVGPGSVDQSALGHTGHCGGRACAGRSTTT
jgi:drug/metabolite transporter (DMT)-like permease